MVFIHMLQRSVGYSKNRKKTVPDPGDFLSLAMTVEVVFWWCDHPYAKEEFKNDWRILSSFLIQLQSFPSLS